MTYDTPLTCGPNGQSDQYANELNEEWHEQSFSHDTSAVPPAPPRCEQTALAAFREAVAEADARALLAPGSLAGREAVGVIVPTIRMTARQAF